ncbi:MAG: UvrD-helicase domain-containing protein [Candidatus Latescibacterota bacterium]
MVESRPRPLADQEARTCIRTALGVNLAVLAGAGAGKTRELVERLVSYVLRVSPDVHLLAAITFTRKAAGEMRGRLLLRLREALAGAEGEERERLGRALERLDQCFVGTIHAFCAQLLRERPVEAGLDPEFTELDERQEALLRQSAWDEFVQAAYERGDARLERLHALGLRAEDLLTFFARRCQFPEVPLKAAPVAEPDLARPVEAARGFVDRVRQHLPEPPPPQPDEFMRRLQEAELFWQHAHLPLTLRQVGWLQRLDRLGTRITQKRWEPNQAFAKDLLHTLYPQFRREVTAPALTAWRQHVYAQVTGYIDEATQFCAARRHALGQLTFQDLLLEATALLRDHPAVRRHFQERYRCLFVDEFQDTDPVQAEMLLYLTGRDPQERDWRRLEPHPGSLFLVGDEKQSIYRFRRADVDTFRLARQRLQETGGRQVELLTSFRSLGRLCAWLNRAFEPLFARQEGRHQAAFRPLLPYHAEGQDAHCVRRITLEKVEGNRRELAARADAARIAAFIQAALEGRTPLNQRGEGAILPPRASPGNFLVLTWTRRLLPLYAQALEERGIPFDITGPGELGELPEVRALVDLVAAVHRPDDPLLLLAYLRGPLVGTADDQLYDFRRAHGVFDYRRPLPPGLPPALQEHFAPAWQRLRQTERLLRQCAPSVALERIAEDLGAAPFATASAMGSSRAGSLLRLLALVRGWEAQGRHWGQVAEELVALATDPEYQVEPMTLEAGRADVVRLMNVHQAKGLQADVVFLADPCDRRAERTDVEFHVSRAGGAPYLSLPVVRPYGEYQQEVLAEPVGWEEDAAEERGALEAEKLRLLYVAATRARHLLVVSNYREHPDRGPWARLYPFLQDVPELESCAAEAPAIEAAPLPDWSAAGQQRALRWQALKAPSCVLAVMSEETVPDEAAGEGAPPGQRGSGRGRSYGSAIHALFELAVQGVLPPQEDALILALLCRHRLDPSLLAAARGALAALRASPLWQEVQGSPEVHTEVPLAVPAEESGLHGARRGVIDLVYRVAGGWKVVDYKTDGVSQDAALHRAQVEAYARCWAAVSGQAVVATEVWVVPTAPSPP